MIFTQFSEKVAHGPRNKLLDFTDSPNHITLGLGLQFGWVTAVLCRGGCDITRRLFNSNNFVTSAALAEVCTLMGAILVDIL